MPWQNFPDGRNDNGAVRSVSGTGARCVFNLGFLSSVGNLNLAGNRVSVVSALEVNGGSYASFSRSGNQITLNGGAANYVAFRGPSGGTLVNGYVNSGFVRSWNGIAGRVYWYTVATAPASVVVVRSGRNVLVSSAEVTSNGDSAVVDYMVQFSTNNGASWSDAEAMNGDRELLFEGLIPGQTYLFRVYAVNAAGAGAARVSSGVLVSGVGKKRAGASLFIPTTIAKRRTGPNTFVDLTIAKRKQGVVFVDLS